MSGLQNYNWVDLVQSILSGREDRRGELIELTQTPLFQFCVYLCGNRHLAEDICHDTYVKALTSLNQLRDPNLILAWLKQIARRLFLDYVKSASQSKTHVSVDDSEEFLQLEAPDGANDQQLDVMKALNQLSEDDRSLLILVDVQGCSYQEVAQTLDIAEGTVKSRVFRARKKFSDIFGNHSEG